MSKNSLFGLKLVMEKEVEVNLNLENDNFKPNKEFLDIDQLKNEASTLR
jgi:hypothetical protein